MNTIDEMIEVLQAHKNGKTIETNIGIWIECPDPIWNFGQVEYRVKKVIKHYIGDYYLLSIK